MPTLVIVGEDDVATGPEKAERLHQAIREARLVTIPKAGHTSTISQPEAVTHVIEDFISTVSCRQVFYG